MEFEGGVGVLEDLHFWNKKNGLKIGYIKRSRLSEQKELYGSRCFYFNSYHIGLVVANKSQTTLHKHIVAKK